MQPIRDPALKGDDTILCSCKLHVNANQVCQTPFWIGNLNEGRQEVPLSPIFPFTKFTPWVLCQVPALVGNVFFLTDHQLFADIAISAVLHSITVHGKKGLFSEELQVRKVVAFPFLEIFKSYLNMVWGNHHHLDLLKWDQIISRGHLPHNLNHSVILWCATFSQTPAEESIVLNYRKKGCQNRITFRTAIRAFVCHIYATQQGNFVFRHSLSYSLNTCNSLGFTGVLAYKRLFLKQSRSHFRHCLGAAPTPTLCLVISLPEHLQAGLLHTWHQRGCL